MYQTIPSMLFARQFNTDLFGILSQWKKAISEFQTKVNDAITGSQELPSYWVGVHTAPSSDFRSLRLAVNTVHLQTNVTLTQLH